MIKYSLRCDGSHAFESWFRDSEAFDRQSAAGLVSCPVCGTDRVAKALMAPAVRTSRKKAAPVVSETPPETPVAEPTVPLALADERSVKLRNMMRAMRDHIVATSTDVGPAFADEARKIHEGLSETKPIYGEASADDVRSLIEDGIDIMPMPVFPDDRN